MRPVTMHDRTLTGPAYDAFDRLSPVYVAIPGPEVTILQMPPRAANTSREFARFGEFEITGLHSSQ